MSDILEDQKIHYIVKDYKRMFEQHEQLIKVCKKYQDLLKKRDNRIRDLENQMETLKNQTIPKPPVGIKNLLGEMQNQLRSIAKRTDMLIGYVEEARTLTKQ